MDIGAEPDRDAVVALLDQALGAAARNEASPEAERQDWLYGSAGFTEPDEHGWMAPSLPELWMPRALCFWHAAISSGGKISGKLMCEPGHSLKRWPVIEQTVGDYLFGSPWLLP